MTTRRLISVSRSRMNRKTEIILSTLNVSIFLLIRSLKAKISFKSISWSLTDFRCAPFALKTRQMTTRTLILFSGSLVSFIYTLVHPVHRWRSCCGHFNFRQRILELGYQRSLFSQDFFHSFGVDFFNHFRESKPKIYCVFTEL